MSKKNIINLIVIILLFLCAFGYSINLLYRFLKPSYKTETVFNYTISDVVNCKGIIIRDEYPLYCEYNGYIDYLVEDADAVSKKTPIIRILNSDKSIDVSNKIKNIKNEIESINSVISKKKYGSGNADLVKEINKISIDSISDISNINEIAIMLEYYLAGNTLSENEYNSLEYKINHLKLELNDLEELIPDFSTTLYSDQDGYFSKNYDGLEKYLNYDLDVLDFDNVEKIIENEKTNLEEKYYGKLIKSHESYFIFKIDEIDSEKFIKHKSFIADLQNINKSIHLKLINIVNHNDKFYAICLCENVDAYILNSRKVDVSIKFSTYSGVKVSNPALRNYQGKDGVFCKTGNLITFKPVEIIYYGPNYVVVKSDLLREYDDVVLEGQNLYDGKVS